MADWLMVFKCYCFYFNVGLSLAVSWRVGLVSIATFVNYRMWRVEQLPSTTSGALDQHKSWVNCGLLVREGREREKRNSSPLRFPPIPPPFPLLSPSTASNSLSSSSLPPSLPLPPGMDSSTDCIVQGKVPTLPSSRDGMFAIMDGGRSADAPVIIQKILPDVLMTELASQEMETKIRGTPSGNSLQYLTHTFLTAHK